MESPRKKMVAEGGDGGESSESVVLQCTDSGAVESGEEVAMADSGSRRELSCLYDCVKGEETGTCVECTPERKAVVSVRCVDRILGGRKTIFTPRMVSFQNDGGCWRTGGRRWCRARKSFMHGPFGVGASFVVDRVAMKRCHEDMEQCSPVVLEEEHQEDNKSDDDSASSSESDASDSESEQRRMDAGSKRRRGGEDLTAKRDESLQMRSGGRMIKPSSMAPESVGVQKEAAAAAVGYDDELKEMQQLLELQLRAAEKREAGMKQRMEQMMDVLSQHMGHVEKRVCNLEREAQPQEQVLERINMKLEQVMEGFSTLNENLAILSACLSKNLDSQ